MVLHQALTGLRTRSSNLVNFVAIFKHHLSSSTTSEELSTRMVKQKKFCESKTGYVRTKGKGLPNIDERLLKEFYTAVGAFVGFDDCRHGLRLRAETIVEKIILQLRDGDRENASTLLKDYDASQEDFVDILSYCASLPDPLFALETWNAMENKGIIPSTISYDLMTQTLCKSEHLEEAFDFIKCSGGGYSFCGGVAVYNIFLASSLEKNNWAYVDQCLALMNERMVGMNEDTYAELLKIAIWNKNLPAIKRIWEECAKYYSASPMSLKKFVWAFSNLGDIRSAYQMLQHMIELVLNEEYMLETEPISWVLRPQLDIPIPVCSTKHNSYIGSTAKNIFLPEESLKLTKDQKLAFGKILNMAFEYVIRGCSSARKNFALGGRLMLQFGDLGLQPTAHIYDAYVRFLILQKRVAEALEVLPLMQLMNIKLLNSTLGFVLLACKDPSDISRAKEYVDKTAIPISVPHYNYFLGACTRLNLPDQGIQGFKHMRQHNFLPNVLTYERLFSLAGNVNFPYEAANSLSQRDCLKRIHAIEMDMIRNNVQHNCWTIMHLLKTLAEEDLLTEFAQYFKIAEGIFSLAEDRKESMTRIYNSVIHSLVKGRHSHMAIEVFKHMRMNGFDSDYVTYCTMFDCCSVLRSYQFAWALVSLMIRDGYPMDTIAYTSLLKVASCCRYFNEACRLLDQMKLEEFELSTFEYNTILKVTCQEGRLDAVEFLLEDMHRSQIKPDSTICSYVFNAYADEMYHYTALEALQVLCLRMIGIDNDLSVEILMSYADQYVFPEDLDVEMQLVQLYERDEDDLAFTLLIMRWCYILDFPICWNPNHSFWAEKTSTAYECIE